MSAELEAAPVTRSVRLADYSPPDYLIDAVDLVMRGCPPELAARILL